jgi:hypothetical protein
MKLMKPLEYTLGPASELLSESESESDDIDVLLDIDVLDEASDSITTSTSQAGLGQRTRSPAGLSCFVFMRCVGCD